MPSESLSEQLQMQQYQREFALLHEQHRLQQTELSQHHHQQTLQLQQAQFYQQQQQDKEYGHQQQQVLFAQEQQQQQCGQHQQNPTFARSHFGSGVMSPKLHSSNLPEHAAARNKHQSGNTSSEKHSKNQDRQQLQQRQQQQQDHHQHHHHHHQHHHRHQQQHGQLERGQGLSQSDIYMAEAKPSELDPRVALGALAGMAGIAGSDEMMTTNSGPSGNDPFIL